MRPSSKKPATSRRPAPVRNLPRVPPGAIVRTFLLAMLAIVACGWAIARYVTHPRAPMMVLPAPAPSVSSSDDVRELPVPDLVPTD